LNPHSYCVAKKDKEFARALSSADVLLPDGIGVVLATKFLRGIDIQKIAGLDMKLHLLKQADEKGLRVFYLGSTQQTLDLIGARVQREYPNVRVAMYPPPFKKAFSPEDDREMIDRINAFRPDIL